MTSIDEDTLYNQLKDLPDFLNLPLPARWFKKYNIPPIEAGSVKEFIDSGYTFKCMFAPKDLPPLIINEPVRDLSGNIKLAVVHEPEKIDVQVISRPYDPDAPPLELENLKPTDQSSEISVTHLDPLTQEQDQTHSPDDVPSTH
jgi:hypothetical protein